jgi:general secretion pathway protein C
MEALFKQYFWVVKGLGLAITAALAASVITTYVGTSYIYGERPDKAAEGDTDTDGADLEDEDDKPAASLLAGAGSGSSSRPSAGDRNKLIQALLSHNLFCPSCVKVEAAPAEVGSTVNPITGEAEAISGGVQPGEVQSSLPLRLVATMESSDPKYSYATLRDEETGGAGPFWPGDNLRPTAVLVSVERSMVHLRNGGALEYIELGVEPPKGAAKPVAAPTKKKPDEDAPKPAGAIEGAENAIKCESENSCTIERAWLEGVLSNPASLAKQARVMPSVKDGETRGFKFYGIRPGSLPKLLNIKNGDLITAVNGTELKSMDGAMSLYAKLRRANNLSVTIERKGESITKEITIQ